MIGPKSSIPEVLPSGAARATRPFPRPLAAAGLASASGLLLFLSDYPVHAVPLQLVALMPALWALGPLSPRPSAAAAVGLVLGLAYAAPLLATLEFPLGFALPLGLYQAALWAAFALGARAVLRWPGPLGPLAAGAVGVLVEWVNIALIPVWGTAQSFVRVWSAVPWAAQLCWATGMLGLVFFLVALQALAVALAAGRSPRRPLLVALVLTAAAPASLDAVLWRRQSEGVVRVAAVGWIRDLRAETPDPFEALATTYEPLLARARGAALVVSPEGAFFVPSGARGRFLGRLSELARQHGAALAVGYMDLERNDNRVAFVGADGSILGEVVKAHLIPFIERYRAGDGSRIALSLAGARVGGMICQDDNFTDLSRGYGGDAAQIVAVPTNDWEQVRKIHLENSLFRPLESGYGIVRAATNGISAIATARGEVLARMDHFESGPGVIAADLPLYRGVTLYSRAGDWLAAAAAALLAAAALVRRWRHRRRGAAGGAHER